MTKKFFFFTWLQFINTVCTQTLLSSPDTFNSKLSIAFILLRILHIQVNTASYLQKSSWLQSPIVSQQLYEWLWWGSVKKSQAIRFHSELSVSGACYPLQSLLVTCRQPWGYSFCHCALLLLLKIVFSILRSDARKTPQSQAVVEGKGLGSFEIPLGINLLGKQAAVRQEERGLLCNACTTAGFKAW